ncbi:MAG: hypothetical protein GY930_04750, partial [bacterium]|nr:hypothetical protein [bacterium]
VTPMQMVRAYAGLATGILPNIRAVHSIDGRELVSEGRRLPIDEHNLRIVHGAMDAVANHPDDKLWRKALAEEKLGARFICKTGSADYDDDGIVPKYDDAENFLGYEKGVRKHTWVVGWLPAENPKLVVAAFVHDTSTTSTHSSAYLMSQFLTRPEIQAYLEEVK